jgi:hypothetical protein
MYRRMSDLKVTLFENNRLLGNEKEGLENILENKTQTKRTLPITKRENADMLQSILQYILLLSSGYPVWRRVKILPP